MGNLKELESDLFKKYKQGDTTAKVELLNSLKPLIINQVKKFSGSGLPEIAVVLEGQRLASAAIDSYDPSLAQLNTHVVTNLKKLNRFVTSYQNVGHIPEPRALLIGKYNLTFSNLEAEKGREPTIEELSDELNINPIEVERLQTELRRDLSSSIIETDEDESGFYNYILPQQRDPRTKQAIDFVYFDADPVDKKILEMTLGLHGFPREKGKDILTKLKLTPNDFKKRKLQLANEIKALV